MHPYLIGLLGGVMAGIINTLAGNGSSITLYILMDTFGLPPKIANASNRVGIVLQGVGAIPQFYKAGLLKFERSKGIIATLIAGAMLGILLAVWVDDTQFKDVFKYMLVLMLGVVLVKPERWLRKTEANHNFSAWLLYPSCFALGVYGGFIQMGMGIFLHMLLVLGARFSLMDSNIIRTISMASFTALAVAIFAYQGMINWEIGGVLAVGQIIGGYLGARFATNYPNATIWAYRLMVIEVLWAVCQLFGVLDFIKNLC